jgi:lysophospholipase L1-like esterase
LTRRRRTGLTLAASLCCLLQAGDTGAYHDGDINIDGTVTVADLLWAEQALLGGRNLDTAQTRHGDVAPLVAGYPQPDGVLDAGDMAILYRIAFDGFLFALPPYPFNQFAIGDSISEGEAAQGDIGNPHHESVWSTGYDYSVSSLNERFETLDGAAYYENTAGRDPVINQAQSGATMADFAAQAQAVVTATAQTPAAAAGMVTVLLGSNDVCADSMTAMTNPKLFEAQFSAGLDVLAASDTTRHARIHVSGIPAIYWLWNAKYSNFWCRVFIWPFVPCANLLDNPQDDCADAVSRQDPDNIHPGDGSDCRRRKDFHRIVRAEYNSRLRNTVAKFRADGTLPNVTYTDVYDVRFDSAHVNGGDCFHPSTAGHALLAEKEWCRTPWGISGLLCSE